MITGLFFIFMNEAKAQKKCKYESDITDPISGDRHRVASTRLLENTSKGITVHSGPPKPYNNALLKYHNINNDLKVELFIKFIGDFHKYIIPAGTELNIKLVNDKIITLQTSTEVIPKHTRNGYDLATTFSLMFDCTLEQMKEIIDAGGIKALGTKFNNESITKIVKKRNIPKTAERASCIISE